MNHVYLSFLGLGQKKKTGGFGYHRTCYVLNGAKASETEFVQAAEIELLGADRFEKLVLVATEASKAAHYKALRRRLQALGAKKIHAVCVAEDMSPEGQWKWFEQVIGFIDAGDRLTVDITHGYRMIPVVFSTAIHFLQQARSVELAAVYYGAFEMSTDDGRTPVFDMKDFYRINRWADAVSRLVEDADARKLAEVAGRTSDFQIGELNDPELIRAFEALTATVRNVDINNVAAKVNAAIELIRMKKKDASVTGAILLDLVVDKFAGLATGEPFGGRYDRDYFHLQLEMIRLLLEHKLFMQAYTAMREFIGSIGMLAAGDAAMNDASGRKPGRSCAEVFVVMICYAPQQWDFPKRYEQVLATLRPFYERLGSLGLVDRLREFSDDLASYRNGFDHGWTAHGGAFDDIEVKGEYFLKQLSAILAHMEANAVV